MSKGHKQGGKITGSHTTVIPAAEKIVDLLQKEDVVRKIAIGFITHGIRNGRRAVKIMDMDSGLLLKVRGTASIQEIRVYTHNSQTVRKKIRIFATKNDYRYTE